MTSGYTRAVIQVFYCYAPYDINLLINLEKHLSPLKRLYAMAGWSSREILAGTNLDRIIKSYLDYADLILLLISPDFLYTDICYSIEMEAALKRHVAGEAVVIPIILRPVLWGVTPVRDLQALPKNNRPITTWNNRDYAFNKVAQGVAEVVKRLVEKYEKRFIEEYITHKEHETQLGSSSWRPTESFRAEKRAEAEEIYKTIYDSLKSIQMEILQEELILQLQYANSINQDEKGADEGSLHTDSMNQMKIEGEEREEQLLGAQHLDTTTNIDDLSGLRERQEKYAEEESLLERMQAIREQELGVQHLSTAKRSIPENDKMQELVSALAQAQQWEDAERMARSIPNINKQAEVLGELASTLAQAQEWNLAEMVVLSIPKGYWQAKALQELASALAQALLWEQAKDVAHSITQHYQQAKVLEELASALVQNQPAPWSKQSKEAEWLYREALRIKEHCLGPEHSGVASPLNGLASLYQGRREYTTAEQLYQRALHIMEQNLGPGHPHTASSLNNLALLYDNQGKDEQAEPLYLRALSIREQQLGPEHPDTASSLNNLAELYFSQDKYEQAEPLVKQALTICEHTLGKMHPHTQQARAYYAHLLHRMGRHAEAAALDQP